MRIKKKDIKESIEQLKQTLDNTEKTLEKLGFKANDYEEFQNLLTQISSDDNTNLDSTENVLPFESIRPKMTKSELIETVKTITEGTKKSRQVLKTIKIKNLRK
jgi:uncharacterized protein Yka (UPF0111/DUF47 family)